LGAAFFCSIWNTVLGARHYRDIPAGFADDTLPAVGYRLLRSIIAPILQLADEPSNLRAIDRRVAHLPQHTPANQATSNRYDDINL